jgi:hypothetical protein
MMQLKKRLGSSAIDMWIDRQMPGNRPLTPRFFRPCGLGAVAGGDVTVLRQFSWCGRERNAFLILPGIASRRDGSSSSRLLTYLSPRDL